MTAILHTPRLFVRQLIGGSLIALLGACGGGGSDGLGTPIAQPAAASTLSGTAATGAAIVGGVVTLKCASGTTASPITGADGAFSVDVSGATLPCLVKVSYKDANGAAQELHSLANSTGTVNVTPLTEMIVAAASGGAPSALFAAVKPDLAAVSAKLPAALATVKTRLDNLGVDTTNLPKNPLGDKFTPAIGNGAGDAADKVLDDLKLKLGSTGKTLATVVNEVSIGQTTNAPVTAGTNTTGTATGTTTTTVGTTTSTTSTGTTSIPSTETTTIPTSTTTPTPTPTTTVTAAVGTQMGGARQGSALNLTNAVTTPASSLYLTDVTLPVAKGELTTDGIHYYIADSSIYRVTKLNPATDRQSSFAGAYTITPGFVDGTGAAAQFGALGGITTDGIDLFVVDKGNHSIRKIAIATGAVTTLAGSGVAGYADGTGAAAQFNNPHGITTDNTNLYVADFSNNRIRKIVIATGVVTTLAGSGVASREDGTGTAATFSNPYALTTDGTHLYEVDLFGRMIRKIAIATGLVTTMRVGNSVVASSSDIRGITTDGTYLYITDNDNLKVVQKIAIATGVVTLLAGGATSQATAVNGVGVAAKFNAPGAITTDGTSLYMTDGPSLRKIQ